jgi:hypothetical protein
MTKTTNVIISDDNYKNYVSLNDFLAEYQSKGPLETPGGQFKNYAQGTLSYYFIKLLISRNNNFSKVVCLPNLNYCIYIKSGSKFKDIKTIVSTENYCEQIKELPDYKLYSKHTIKSNLLLFNPPEYSKNYIKNYGINAYNIVIPNSLKNKLLICEQNNKYIVFINLFLVTIYNDKVAYQHSNIIIINILLKTIERFDPHGGSIIVNKLDNTKTFKNLKRVYKQELIDEILKDKFKNVLKNYKYLNLYDTCPYLGPQAFVDAFDGLCITWSLMYFILRVLNPKLKQFEINNMMISGSKEKVLDKVLRFNRFVIDYLRNS